MAKTLPLPVAGYVFEVAYPFVHDSYSEWDEDGCSTSPCWKPGVTMKEVWDDQVAYADGMGKQIITIVGVYRPGKFPTRVFYTRKWVDPNGHTFGKNRCRSTTLCAFRSLVREYRHEFVLDESPLPTRSADVEVALNG